MLFLGQFREFLDAVSGNGRRQEGRNDRYDVVECSGHAGALRQEQGHCSVGDLMCPEEIQAVAEDAELDQASDEAHEDTGLDGEQVVVQEELLVAVLPVTELAAVQRRDAEGFDRVHVVEGFHFKGHDLGGHFPGLLVVFALFADHETAHQQHHRCGCEGQYGHEMAVVPDDDEGRNEVVYRNDDVRDPVDRIAGNGAHIVVEAVEEISAAVLGDIQPSGIHDLVENVCLDLMVDAQGKLGRDPFQDIGEDQAEDGTADTERNEKSQFFVLVAGNDIDDVLGDDAGYQAERGTDDTEKDIEENGSFVLPGIGNDELPVIQDFIEGTFLPSPVQNVQGLEGSVFT